MKRTYLVGLMLVFLGSATAVSKEMTYGEPQQAESFDPYTAQEVSVQHLSDLLFNSLFKVTPGGAYTNELASDYKVENSGRSVLVSLKSQVKWAFAKGTKNYGSTLSAKDVQATIHALRSSKGNIPNSGRFQVFAGAEVVAPYQVRVKYTRALKDPLRPLLIKILPHTMLSQGLDRNSDIAKNPVGTGPYRVIKISPQGEVLLERNSGYFGAKPSIDKIIMKPFTDPTILSQSLMYGGVDLSTKVTNQDLQEVMADNRLEVVSYDNLSYSFLAFNLRKKLLGDKKFRLALMHAIDRKEILKAFFSEKGRSITGPFAPSSWAYNLDVSEIAFDLSRAKGLLDDINIKDTNNDGFREDAGSNPLELSFSIPLDNQGQMIKRIALALAGYLNKLGIRTKMVFMPWTVWKEQIIEKHDFDMTLASWSFDDASNIFSLFHSSESRPGGNNFVGFNSPLVDTLLQESQVTNDFEKKILIYHKLHSILASEQAYGFLWNVDSHGAHYRKIRGVRVEPFAFFKHIESWKISE